MLGTALQKTSSQILLRHNLNALGSNNQVK